MGHATDVSGYISVLSQYDPWLLLHATAGDINISDNAETFCALCSVAGVQAIESISSYW